MKKRFNSRFRKDLFPEMPETFPAGLLRAAQSAGANPRRIVHARTALRWAATAAAAFACIVVIVLVAFLRRQRDPRAMTSPGMIGGAPLIDTWRMSQIDYQGVLISAQTLGAEEVRFDFCEDGTVQIFVAGDDADSAEARYVIEGDSVHIETADGTPLTVGRLFGSEGYPSLDLFYDPETDTLNAKNLKPGDADIKLGFVLMRVQKTDPARENARGEWAYVYPETDVALTQRLTVKGDGTAIYRFTSSMLAPSETTLTYTVEDSVLTFTGGLIEFTARYEASDDTLSVTQNGETLRFTRVPVDPVGKWTMTAVGMNGTSVDPSLLGMSFMDSAGLGVWLEFTDDGGPTHGHDSGKMMLTGVMDGSDSLRQDGIYRVNGTIITAVDEKGEAMEIRYDPETDTLTIGHDYDDSVHVSLIFSRTPDVVIPTSLVGKWTRIRQEIADDDGKVWTDPAGLPDADESWTEWQSWLVFGKDGRVTLTDCYDPKTGNALHNASKYRLASERDVEIDFGDGYSMQYDRESDTILLYINDRTRYTYARTPDAVIPDAQTPGSAVDAQQQEYKRLEKQYPAYFDLDTEDGLAVYVWQMSSDGYCCALLSGSDNRTEAELSRMKGTTIEEMRLILNTYEIEDNDIDVVIVPFRNPLSSYWYEIDKAYTDNLIWLLIQVSENDIVNKEVCDVDGDGQLETCELSYGPTSGLFTVTFTVYRNGTEVYCNTFNMEYGYLQFERSNGKLSISHTVPQNDGTQLVKEYAITVDDGMLVLTDAATGKDVEYWGTADPQWNLHFHEKKEPEDMLEGLWCAMNPEEGVDGLLEIGFYKDAATGERMASFLKDGVFSDKYSYTVEEGERNKTDDPWYRFTFTDGDEEQLLDLVLDGKEPVYMERNVGKGKGGWKTYYKCPIIEAEELPMKQDKYIFAGEGRVHYLDIVDLNGDGKPVRVSVYGYTPVSVVTGEEGESELTVQIGACEWKINEKLVMDSGIYIDLDPNDGHGNLLLSTTRADGTEKTYELHVENGELVCGHTVEGYCFLNDSEQQELMLGTPTDLLGAKYGYCEVKGEALEPADEWLQASALIERIMFGKREDNIKDGTLLHLVRALPCEIDDKPATLEPGVYMHLREWHESMDRIVFLTEDDRRITVYLDGTAPYTVDGVALTDYFDNAPKG